MAENEAAYGSPTVPNARGLPPTTRPSETAIEKGSDVAVRPSASVTRTRIPIAVPPAVGVPEIAPAGDRARPAGSVPAYREKA